jgi:hypothetical protein
MSTFNLAQQLRASMQRLGFEPLPIDGGSVKEPDSLAAPAEKPRNGQNAFEDLYALKIDGPARSVLR